jgi:MFS family permease
VPLALIYLRQPPEVIHPAAAAGTGVTHERVHGLKPNTMFAMICAAAVLCCIPMAMPQGHLVAFCSDLGFSRTFGAAMLSLLLGAAFLSRQLWGALSDRIGGLATILIGSVLQAGAMAAFLATQSEVGLITVSIAFGIGFSGIIPAYVLALRELFPAREAYWRIPTLLMTTTLGMAAGGWAAGLLYDHFGYYLPAFSFGLGANLVHMTILGFLVWRATGNGRHTKLATA